MKQVQISESLFLDLCKYHLGGVCDTGTVARIKAGLSDKMERAAAREQYTERLSLNDNKTEP